MLLARAGRAALVRTATISVARRSTVAEQSVSCTFILEKKKQKVTVPGMVGWSLLETAQHHGLPIPGSLADEKWDYTGFGEGPASAEDHVVVQREFFEKLEPMGFQECNVLDEVSETITGTSRLASCIYLSKELDGITVLFPDDNPDTTNLL